MSTAVPQLELHLSNSVISGTVRKTLAELLKDIESVLDAPGTGPVVLTDVSEVQFAAAALWLASTQRDGMVLPQERLTGPVRELLGQSGYSIQDLRDPVVPVPGASGHPGRVRLLTSGSTGQPKLIEHSWHSLFTMARVRPVPGSRWLMTYQAGTYAWYQILTAVFYLPGQSLVLGEGRDPGQLISSAAEAEVTAISATPTFWRLALLQAPPERLQELGRGLQVISLGGEPVDQPILDRLAALFPGARRVHIYASSEAGASIVVTDGRAGFPASWLEEPGRSPELRVRDGRLWVKSPHAAVGFQDFIDTQDLAEIRGDRVHLLGRSGHDFINIGGAKAHSADIERILLGHPAVLWCRVRGVKAPLVGQLVAAQVVLNQAPGIPSASDAQLAAYCRDRLPEHMVPRVWERLERIPSSTNWKTQVR